MSDNIKIEYRVREVTRYQVTRHYEELSANAAGGGTESKGEFPNASIAHEVAYALCSAEHKQLGYPIDDPRVQYPNQQVTEAQVDV